MASEAVKKRDQNWTNEEKDVLFQLVSHRLDIIENKSVSTQVNVKKIKAWKQVHADFSAQFGNKRTVERIREQWKRLKSYAKANGTSVKKYWKKTGGGRPPAPSPPDHEYTVRTEEEVTDEASDVEWALAHSSPREFKKDESEFDSDRVRMDDCDSPNCSDISVDYITVVELSDNETEPLIENQRTPSTSGENSVFHVKKKKKKKLPERAMTLFEKEMLNLNKIKHEMEEKRSQELHELEVEKKKLELEALKLKMKIITKVLEY